MIQTSTLNSWLDTLDVHFIVDMADSLRHAQLIFPAGLEAHFNALPTHLILDMVDANRLYGLSYPHALIGDTTPAQEEGTPAVVPVGPGSAKIRWRTNEFSRGMFEFGFQPGQYTQSVA